LWLQGGPPQHETFDPKPHAPSEIRGPFNPISTNVTGTHFCELLPRTARIADKLAVVRSLATDNNLHCASGYEVLTGYRYTGTNSRVISPTTDWPYFGSMVKMFKPSDVLPPLSVVWIPQIMRLNENVTPAGQTAGFLGQQWDPDRFEGEPWADNYHVDGLDLGSIPVDRLHRRRALLDQVDLTSARLDARGLPRTFDQFQAQAFDLLTSGRVQNAFAVDQEPDALRDTYGRTRWGQCCLLARRLVEAGVRLVHVGWPREPGDSAVDNPMWDTHAQNADRMEDVLAPIFDVGFTALINDLDQRGLLAETLVVAIAEFGRTPKINSVGGRDHWGPVFSFAMAGAGVQAGTVYGASDPNGAYPAKDRVTGGDVTATLFHLLGIPHTNTFRDVQGREHHLTQGNPIEGILDRGRHATPTLAASGGSLHRVPPYNDDLLLHPDFSEGVELMSVETGSRPKGWRAAPFASAAENVSDPSPWEVRIIERDGRRMAALGIERAHQGRPMPFVPAKARLLLAQEIRNPRLGTFHLRVNACVRTESEADYQEFIKRCQFRLVLHRYNDESKNPVQRTEFKAETFVPPRVSREHPEFAWFEMVHKLDSPGPGQNFPIGNGYGIAVEVVHSGAEDWQPSLESDELLLCIEQVRLEFMQRTINDDVTV
ncbi:MAG: DUF1501 domain-containing protein, partial [Planctomycetaceae bacterium]|nr:DUF1501 domain-containing protein [Planctomycetaceae bacterium]